MEGLVNYSSEDEHDYPYSKVAVRERGGGSTSGRSAVDSGIGSSGVPLKRRHERSRSSSFNKDASPYRKSRDPVGGERFKSGNTSNYNDEDKYKSEKRADKFRDPREKRDSKDVRNYSRDVKRDYDNGHKHDYRKHDDHKRYRDPKRDFKRDNNDYYNKDDKRHNRYDDRKTSPPYTSHYNKDRFNSSKPRYDDRKSNEERPSDKRINEDRRSGVGNSNYDDRRRDFSEKRNFDDDRKSDRRSNEYDRRPPHRSYNEDRSSTYRPRRSNSPSTLPPRNTHNKYYERKDDSNPRRDRRRHSKSPRSRSRSVEKSIERDQTSHNNSQKEEAGTAPAAGELIMQVPRPEVVAQVTEKKPLPTARNFEALLNLPLSETAHKYPNVVTVPPISTATGPSAATTTTVQLPSYYNPNVINPNKYVEQMQKRKLIWGAKKVEDSASKWGHAQFSQDQDGKVASKFMRLMGIKGGAGAESSTSATDSDKKTIPTSPSNSTDVKSREAMFTTMEQQYEVARQVTHTMRGVGLGFGSQPRPY